MKFSNRANNAQPSPIRETFKYLNDPEIISLAGGLPAPELFPVPEVRQAMREVLEKDARGALQYSGTDGFRRLREQICARMEKAGIKNATPDNVLVTNGSQQALSFAAQIFLNEGDTVITEAISYPGAICAFRWSVPKYKGVPMDSDGMDIDALEKCIKETPDTRLIYTIPEFQNPTGITMSQERKKRLAEISGKYQIPVLEDNPYGELYYDDCAQHMSVKSFDRDGYVIYLGSMSKIFCPGLRVGWVYTDNPLIHRKFVLCKQTADMHTNELSQRLVSAYLDDNDIEAHIEKIRALYKSRRDLMLKEIDKKFPKSAKVHKPGGGMFIWVTLPENLDTTALMEEAAKNKVLYVHGEAFCVGEIKKNALRLNFSNMPEEKIIEGVDRLGKLFARYTK